MSARVSKKPPQHPRKRACAECRSALALVQEHLSGRKYKSLDDALRNLLQAFVTMKGNAADECETRIEITALRESVSWLEGEFQEFRVQAAENLKQAMSERDNYRILRDAASEASLRLRMLNLKLDADCAAIRAERDDVLLKQLAAVDACKPKRGFWSWVMRQKSFVKMFR